MSDRFKILRVQPPAPGLESLGTVDFAYQHAAYDGALKIHRWVKPTPAATEGGQDKPGYNVETLAVVSQNGGTLAVKVTGAIVQTGKRGPYVQCNGADVPRDVREEVAVRAAGMIENKKIRRARIGNAGTPEDAGSAFDSIDEADIPF